MVRCRFPVGQKRKMRSSKPAAGLCSRRIGGSDMDLRSKARTLSGPVSDPQKLPNWNYDGSSTGQAPGKDSEVIQHPQAIFRDPSRRGNNILGPYYCGIGADKAFGREDVDSHYKACLYAGINISGINGEVDNLTWGGHHFKPLHLEVSNLLGELEKGQRRELREEEKEVMKQLKRKQAYITIYELIMASRVHVDTVLQLFNRVHVPIDISPEDLFELINPVHYGPVISFTESDLPRGGASHLQALYITVDILEKRVPLVLVDNGSALNLCPLSTTTTLGIDPSECLLSRQIVRAYDSTCREVIGVVTLPVIIGPVEFKIEFQIMDILASFKLLLGRPWIHLSGAVPSSLHQKIKFPHQGSVVTLNADMEMNGISRMPVYKIDQEPSKVLLSEFEYVQVIKGELKQKELVPLDSNPHANLYIWQIIKEIGFFLGMGLGRRLQGILEALKHPSTIYSYGLGYKSTKEDQKLMA